MKFASLTLIALISSAFAGEFVEQTDVPEDHDCSCAGYEKKAAECDWPKKDCDVSTEDFSNFDSACTALNNFRKDKREGNIEGSYNRTLTCMANMSADQRRSIATGLVPPKQLLPTARSLPVLNYPTNASLPVAANWTSYLPAVKIQKMCASCWAFVSIALCEFYFSYKKATRVVLSEQPLVSCFKNGDGCGGDWPSMALYYLRVNGTTTNSTYGYTGTDTNCTAYNNRYYCPKASEEYYEGNGNCTRLRQLLAQGPVAGVIYAGIPFGQYKTGVFVNSTCPTGQNHAVTFVGYGVEKNVNGTDIPFFILRNTYGSAWGENGYMKIDARNNTCGICNYFWYN